MAPKRLPTLQLGRNGPQVHRPGWGLMELSVGQGPMAMSDEERFKILDRAWELGITLWDTAAFYGDNEVLIGKWFQLHPERRNDIFLATKFGVGGTRDDDGKVTVQIDSSPEKCRTVCEQSLQKFGIDCVDLLYVQRFDKVTPVEKIVKVMVELKNEGKIKYLGFSECSSDTLRRGHAVHPISAVQMEYNPWSLDIESEAGTNLLSTCRELGVAIVSYSPLGRGVLTGRYKTIDDLDAKDPRRILPRFHQENFSKNLNLVKIFEELAAQKGCTSAQVVLAWIMSQGQDFFPIPGTKTIKYLEQNLDALDVEISQDDDKPIRDSLESMGGVSGARTFDSLNPFADTPAL